MRVIGKEGINKGAPFDVPDNLDIVQNAPFKDSIERENVEIPKKEDLVDTVNVANAFVRGDDLSDPADAERAAEIADRAHAIVHTNDPDAKAEEAVGSVVEDEWTSPWSGYAGDPGEDTTLSGASERNREAVASSSSSSGASAPQKASDKK